MRSNHSYAALFDDIRAGKTDALTAHYARGGKGVQRNGQTLLMCAIDANNSAAIDMILATPAGQWGLNNLTDRQGNTALHYAYTTGNQKLVDQLSAPHYNKIKQQRNNAGLLPEEVASTQTPFVTQKPEAAVDSTLVTPAASVPEVSDIPQSVRPVTTVTDMSDSLSHTSATVVSVSAQPLVQITAPSGVPEHAGSIQDSAQLPAVSQEIETLIENIKGHTYKWNKQGNQERTLTFSFEKTSDLAPDLSYSAYLARYDSAVRNVDLRDLYISEDGYLEAEAEFRDNYDPDEPEENLGEAKVFAGTDELKETVRRVLSKLATQIGLEFVETEDTVNSNLHFLSFSEAQGVPPSNTLGFVELRPHKYNDQHSVILIRTGREHDEETVSHEIGHALGLEHPKKQNEDIDRSVMLSAGPLNFQTYSAADIAALQRSYGPDTVHIPIETLSSTSVILPAIRGTDEADKLPGSDGDDFIAGLKGDDELLGNKGNDTLWGGKGNDLLSGGEGKDILHGGDGDDILDGDDGDDILAGDNGDDTLRGGKGADLLWGGKGKDILTGGEGSDIYMFARGHHEDIVLSDGNTADDADTLLFGENIYLKDLRFEKKDQDLKISIRLTGDSVTVKDYYTTDRNTIRQIELFDSTKLDRTAIAERIGVWHYGDDENNVLTGGAGDDYLYGKKGNDILTGGEGSDYLCGGKGNDILTGGEGGDIYSFDRGDGEDTILSDGNTTADFDVLMLGDNIKREDLHFEQINQDLKIILSDNGGSVTVKDYATTGRNTIRWIGLRDGTGFDSGNIATLINSMATFKPDNQGNTDNNGLIHGDLSATLDKSRMTLPTV